MGHIFGFNDARRYRQWHEHIENRYLAQLETNLVKALLEPLHGDRVLDIGCGIGVGLETLLSLRFQVTGLDASPYMLDMAKERLGHRVEFYRGFAESLPFEDNTFNHACLMTTLEFVDDPQKVIGEACRVAKDRLYIGILNRHALEASLRPFKIRYNTETLRQGRWFTIGEIKHLIRLHMGQIPVHWYSSCLLPPKIGTAGNLNRTHVWRHCPFGAVAGMVAMLTPRFTTRPLKLKYTPKKAVSPAPGLLRGEIRPINQKEES